jgi:undecaprenyl phosphate-alpha-L-ara4N flippase subunit ArnE
LSRDSESRRSATKLAERAEQPRRRKLTIANLALLLFAVAAAASGQLLLKTGMNGARLRANSGEKSLAVAAATTPYVWLGLMVFGISAIAWMVSLSNIPLSIAYPFNALGFLTILIGSAVLLHEKTNIWTWVGTAAVIGGLLTVVLTRQQ